MPIRSDELSPEFARRAVWYANLVDDVVTRGVRQRWMSTYRRRVTPQRYGYGRYFIFVGVQRDIWLGINLDMWATSGDTPLWLGDYYDPNWWRPIHLKPGVEYPEVLDDVASQLKAIAKSFGANLPTA